MPITIRIDDKIYGTASTYFSPFFASWSGADNALWVPFLEKAFAKYRGNYAAMDSGEVYKALRFITGMPGYASSLGTLSQTEKDAKWTELKDHFDND